MMQSATELQNKSVFFAEITRRYVPQRNHYFHRFADSVWDQHAFRAPFPVFQSLLGLYLPGAGERDGAHENGALSHVTAEPIPGHLPGGLYFARNGGRGS